MGEFFRRVWYLVNRRRMDEELQNDLEFHREMALREGRGREFGNVLRLREQSQEAWGWTWIDRLGQDLRYAVRSLYSHAGFTTICVLTLALGIGASTAIFSAVNPILFESLPYPDANRIMMVWSSYQGNRDEVAFGTYRELLERSHSFSTLAAFEPWQPTMVGGTQPERFNGQSVSASYFKVLGVSPVVGRDFRASEDVFRGPQEVILSDSLWERLFHRDPMVAGRQIKLDGDNYTVVGVMPRAFENVVSPSAEIWTLEQYDTRQLAAGFNNWAWNNHLRVVGRVRPGVSAVAARDELEQIARVEWPQFPRPRWVSLRQGLIVDSLQDDMGHSIRTALLAVLGAVILVLGIACVNVINLLLGRGAQRRGEFAVRTALGASRLRVVRQLVTESLLLALVGGTVGMGVALAGVRALIALSPPELPRLGAISINGAAFGFGLGITTLIGLITGVIPALHVSREGEEAGLRRSSRRMAGGQSRTRRALVVTEVAFALVLLVSAGLLLRSMARLLAIDPGFDASHLLTLQVQTSGHEFDDVASAPGAGDAARRRFFEQALETVRQVPGVKQAAFTSLLPLSDDPPVVGVYGSEFEEDGAQGGRNVFRYAVSGDYCETMGIALKQGRSLDEGDTSSSPQVALISESLAKSRFPGQSPIGKRLHVGPTNRPWYVVVGVVGDVKQNLLALDQPDAVYLSTNQTWFADDTVSFVVRSEGDAKALVPAVKAAIWSVDKDQPIVRVATMEKLLAVSEAERRFVLILFEAFGLVALALAGVGIYGVLSGSVTERTREIGVRAALGASRGDILALVLRDGLRLTALGIVVGLLGGVLASRALITLLFGVSVLDPVTYVGVVGLLGGVSAIACLIPAWRAAQVDPSITLRAE